MSGISATVVAVAEADPQQTYETSGPLDPTRFYPRTLLLPGVRAVREQTGAWTEVGRSRRLLLSDGGHVVETITDTQSPGYFAYELSDFQKIFGKLVTGARAEWRFQPMSVGTRVTWCYTFYPKPGRSVVVAAIVRMLWAPYMRKVLPPIVHEVSRQAAVARQ